ncbi:MAG: hypothetical protein AAF702_08740 [Chloroflexota bacterium]
MAQQPPSTKIDQRLEGPPIVVGQRTIRPIAKITGRQQVVPNGSFAGVWGRVSPETILVQDGEEEYTVSMSDPERVSWQGYLMGALAVSGTCLLISIVAGRIANR